MRKVAIVAAGLTKFGERWESSFRELAGEAALSAIQDAKNLDAKGINAMYIGSMAPGRLIGQEHIGALVSDYIGLKNIPATRVEAACASGGIALRSAYLSVASGAHDVVLAMGAEKMTEVSTEEVATALGGAGDQEWELFGGVTFPAIYALLARRHMQDYGTTEEQMALCSVKNHKNAIRNRYAQFRREISLQDVMESGYVASPLKLLDCSPITDGAAAIILCDAEKAKKFCDAPIEIAASAQSNDTLAIADRENLTEMKATKFAIKEALKQAKIELKKIKFAEVHDCFTIAEILAIEDLGFCKKGEGGKFTQNGNTEINGKISVNTSGGLKAKGHPVGATGIAQAAEAVFQLQNRAEGRQVANAEYGLTHNVGGSGATAVVHIYKRA